MDDASYDSQSVQLEVGDSLVLLTDGILEARNRDNQLFGNERIVSVAKQHGLLPAREIAKAILIDLTNFCDGRAITDDVTLLVLKRKQ
jgi:sigma-B regulation protein RsbU (phosphoserine phosphatase)